MEQTEHFLDIFFNPRSIALVGATNNPEKMNYQVLKNLVDLGFKGEIFPVNPREKEILGLKAYRNLSEIPNGPDLVISAVPASKTLEIVHDCDRADIRHLVIITGGFSEGDDSSKRRHEEIAKFIAQKGIRTLGPNTLSPAHTDLNLIVSFMAVKEMNNGNLSFAFQSGFYEPKLNWMFSHLGISKLLDMGNKIDINELDALSYFAIDPSTEIIAMHIESLHSKGRDFLDCLQSVTPIKPVIILKSGRTEAGSKAAASHTGSMASENDAVFSGMLKQAGAFRARNLEEFYDLAKAFQYLPLPQNNRIAILTLSGGEGVMATDACEMNGLAVAGFSGPTHDTLSKLFPPWEIELNPFDIGVCMEFHLGELPLLVDCLFAVARDDQVDAITIQMPPFGMIASFMGPDISKSLSGPLKKQVDGLLESLRTIEKPIVFWSSSQEVEDVRMQNAVESVGIPVFPSSERAMRAIAALLRFFHLKRNT
jgi:acetate---CoA ligase (ADP-forming)